VGTWATVPSVRHHFRPGSKRQKRRKSGGGPPRLDNFLQKVCSTKKVPKGNEGRQAEEENKYYVQLMRTYCLPLDDGRARVFDQNPGILFPFFYLEHKKN
jgi:hypothetical protein